MKRELPKFVSLDGGTALRLKGKQYWRDGGLWGVEYKWIKGVLLSWNPNNKFNPQFDMPWLHRKPLIEITEEEWRKDNGQYAPKNIETNKTQSSPKYTLFNADPNCDHNIVSQWSELNVLNVVVGTAYKTK